MKKLIIIISFILSLTKSLESKDMYVGINMGIQDGLNGGKNSKEYGLKVGKKLNDTFTAEIKTRTKLKDSSTSNDQRAEVAMIGNLKLNNEFSLYTRAGSGMKFVRDADYGYWTIEPGVNYKLNNKWSLKTGVRFRDSFNTSHNQTDTTYKVSVSYKLNDNNSVSLGTKIKRGDSQYNALGIGYKISF
tara:strand:+ start:122 stop:685 length:564 start_codon:yes stop_codon:yes gene_type:complete